MATISGIYLLRLCVSFYLAIVLYCISYCACFSLSFFFLPSQSSHAVKPDNQVYLENLPTLRPPVHFKEKAAIKSSSSGMHGPWSKASKAKSDNTHQLEVEISVYSGSKCLTKSLSLSLALNQTQRFLMLVCLFSQ